MSGDIKMSGDIVDLLRLHGNVWCMNGCHIVGHPAADEIERLRTLIAKVDRMLLSYGDNGVIYPEEAEIIAAVEQEARSGNR